MRREMGKRIAKALTKLSPRERMVFEMKHYQGLKLRTIGEALNTTEETAKNTLFRATQKLRAALVDLKSEVKKAIMNCDWVQENIALYLYNELADDARHELEGHIERCAECAAELKALRVFHDEMAGVPQLEVTPNLLASARMQLAEALETAEQHRGWRWALDPMALLRQMRFSPHWPPSSLSSALAVGLALCIG